MYKQIKKIVIGIVLTVFMGLGLTAQASEFSFAVLPEIPDNQIDTAKSYFDLKMAKGQKQTLKVVLQNSANKDITVSTVINSATTNLNGVVEYGPNKIKADKTLTYNLKDMTKLPKEVKLAKGKSETLEIEVTAPDKDFKGTIAGGITFKEVKDKATLKAEEESQDGKGLSIKNEFSYMVALVVRQTEDKVAPNLNLLKAFPEQVNARNVISAQLQNDKPSFINQVKITTAITKRAKDKVLYEKTQDNMQITPNSSFNYPTPLNGSPLEAGKYTMHVLAFGGKHADGKYKDEQGETYRYKWELSNDFEITREEANTLNSTDVDIKKDNSLWYILGGIFALLLAGLLIFFVKRRNKEVEEEELEPGEM